MTEMTAAMIEQRNEKYLNDLQGNIGKYLSFLSTMARFHKYPVADLTSFAIEAPAMFTAVASAEFWAKHFRRKISPHAKGVTLIKDGKKTVYYDVSETETSRNNPLDVRLWQYDNSAHKKFIDAVVSGESDTERQIHVIAEELANRSSIDKKSKKLLTLSVEAVILERMGLSTENATRQLARISFKEHDIPALLNETQATARIFLDSMQKSVKLQAAENVDALENNPLLDKLGVIQTQEKVEQIPEPELKSKEKPVQLGLFDDYTATQPDIADKTKSIVFEEEIYEPEKTLGVEDTQHSPFENTNEEKLSTDTESGDSNPLEEIFTAEETTEIVDNAPIATEQDNFLYESIDNIERIATSDADETLATFAENINEENATTITENADAEHVEEILATENVTEVVNGTAIDTATNEQGSIAYEIEENSESAETQVVDEILTAPDESISEENTATDIETTDAEHVEEIPATENVTDEQGNSDYDFEEMDEEEEILPNTIEKQSKVEILSDENSQSENISSEQTPEENFNPETPPKDATPDLQTILAEDMLAIRGNSIEKNIFRKNVIAIRTLQQIEREKRPATPEELQALKEYAGFGGIPKAFDKNDANWNREAWLLRSMLTDKEYNAARGSVLNAHYTSDAIVQNIYSGLENLGFNQGTILEPSMGVGGFFGNMPDEMRSSSHLYGVELDSLTGRMAKAIYPDAEINIQGFEDTRYLNNSFDLAVGNVPFGDYHVNDKGYNEHHFLIHDYFIAKMLDQVRPNGLVAVITSKGTLDKQDSRARRYFARRAELVRAIRLPNNAFKNARTEVTCDILFFRKLDRIRDEENLPNWVNVHAFNGERDITINNYFAEHP